eukprot:2887-Heterococcus_DN1.PRE.4
MLQVRAVHAKAHAAAAADTSKRAPADADAATWDQLPPDAIEQLSAPVALWHRGRSSRQNSSASGSNSPTAATGRSNSSSGSGGAAALLLLTEAAVLVLLLAEWAPLVAKDCERVAAAGRMSSGPGAEAMAWIEPKELEQAYPALFELVTALHGLPFELNAKAPSLQLSQPIPGSTMLSKLPAGGEVHRRLDSVVAGGQTTGYAVTA